jgi:broad specificity phosphatase PhoE
MRTELEQRLRQAHPQLFWHLRVDPLAVPIGRGIETGDGWYELIDRLCSRLDEELAHTPDPAFAFEQVKQKFGMLRVYTTPTANARLTELIAEAVGESRTTCEPCGASGATLVTHAGVMRTRCEVCRMKRD